MNIPIVHQTPPNPRAARENRLTFDALGVICVNVVGGTGCGKTSLLAAILPRLKAELNVGVLEGDLATTCDAQRLGACGVPVVQVLTDGQSHLGAHQVQRGMAELPLADLDLLIIENVGDPLCAGQVGLGEHLRAAMLSISAGHLITSKYPELIHGAQLILLSKYDLLPHVDFDLDGTVRSLRRTNPGAEIICTDSENRVGIDRTAGWLLGYVRAQRMHRMRRQPAEAVAATR
ncbi:MAG: hydrogenase nickel incorporation protein HypB [Phycisphaerae bacterium]|nr:hydrogenase nickel incorporation protein HypB [Phycisphaerae bacterium]